MRLKTPVFSYGEEYNSAETVFSTGKTNLRTDENKVGGGCKFGQNPVRNFRPPPLLFRREEYLKSEYSKFVIAKKPRGIFEQHITPLSRKKQHIAGIFLFLSAEAEEDHKADDKSDAEVKKTELKCSSTGALLSPVSCVLPPINHITESSTPFKEKTRIPH